MNRKTVCAFLFLLMAAFAANASAGSWIDDWLTSSTVSQPGYFSGSQRGYYTAGSFQARWPGTGVVYPVTVTPPKIKAGCGGINIFMGGFSFMNAQYLVQKLQAILANAPAVAFNLALHTLCTPCENIMSKMEQLSDALNHLQLDACKLSQMAVAKVYTGLGGEDAGEKGLADKSYMQETGMSDLFHAAQSLEDASGGAQTLPDSTLLSGCPADIVNVFGTPGTVLQNMALYLQVSQQHIDFARGIIGDVAIQNTVNAAGAQTLNFHWMPRCKDNPNDYKSLMESIEANNVYSKSATEQCVQVTSMIDQIKTTLDSVITKMENSQSLSQSETDLLNRLPLPIHNIFKTAIATNSIASTEASLADAISKYYIYAMIRDLFDEVWSVANQAREVNDKQRSGSQGSCQYAVIDNGVYLLNNNMVPELKSALTGLQGAYQAAMKEIETNVSLALKFQQYEKQANSRLSSMFLPALGTRSR
jgi:conjugative transfer pilus assembly protein TraH